MTNLIKSILIVTLLGFSALFIASCNKDDEKQSPSKTAMLTTGKWKLTAASIKTSSGDVRDYMPVISECFRDNLHEFKTDFKYVVSEGTNPCPNGDQSVGDKGTWAFTENDTMLQFAFPYYGGSPYQVNTLTSSSLVLILQQTDGSLTLTFTKQ